MRIPTTIRTDNAELRQAWEKLARIINYELPDQLVTLPIQESDVTNLVEDLAKKQDKSESESGGGSSITLPIKESDVTNLVEDLAKCEKADNKDKPYGYPRLTGEGIVPDNELPVQAQTIAPVAHKWLNSFDRPTGTFTQTQPAAADLSDGVLGVGPVMLETAGIPQPWRKRFCLWSIIKNTNFSVLLDEYTTLDGGIVSTFISPSSTSAASLKDVINAGNLNSFRTYTGLPLFYTDRECVFDAKIGLATAGTGFRFWVGFSSNSNALYNSETSVGIGNVIAFRFNSVDSANWVCCVGTTVAMTAVDSGVAASVGTDQRLSIKTIGAEALFYINGSLVATINTNYPSASTLFIYYALKGTGVVGSGGNGVRTQYIYAENGTP